MPPGQLKVYDSNKKNSLNYFQVFTYVVPAYAYEEVGVA